MDVSKRKQKVYGGAAPFPLTRRNAAGHSFALLQVMAYPLGAEPAQVCPGLLTPQTHTSISEALLFILSNFFSNLNVFFQEHPISETGLLSEGDGF